MMQQSGNDFTPLPSEAQTLNFADDLRLLAAEAKTFAEAELAFQKSRASFAQSEIKSIAALLAAAAVVVFFAAVALVVGTVIALGPALGLWGAAASVTVALILLAAICVALARARIKRMMAIISDSGNS